MSVHTLTTHDTKEQIIWKCQAHFSYDIIKYVMFGFRSFSTE